MGYLERDLLLSTLRILGELWEDNHHPDIIGSDIQNVELLAGVNRLVHQADKPWPIELLRQECSAFLRVYRSVMLRDIEEPIGDGIAETGRD